MFYEIADLTSDVSEISKITLPFSKRRASPLIIITKPSSTFILHISALIYQYEFCYNNPQVEYGF